MPDDIQVETADGVRHSFPSGTSDAVIDGAIKKYVSGQRVASPTKFETERNTGGDRGVFSGLSESIPSYGSVLRRAMLGGIDPLSDFAAVKALGQTGKNFKTGMQTASDIGAPDLANRLTAGTASALGPLVGINPQNMAERAERGDTSGIVGQSAIPALTAMSPLIAEAGGAARTGIAKRIYEGEALKPSVKTASQLGGAAIGGAYGATHGPYSAIAGGAAGYKLGPTMMETMFPRVETPTYPGAMLPSTDEFYSNRANEINAANKVASRFDKMQSKVPDWEAPTHAESPLGSPEYPGPFSKLPTRLPSNLRGDPFAPRPSPLDITAAPEEGTSRSNVASDPQDLISRMKKIAIPGEEPTAADLKRAGDMTNASTDRLKTLARFGDKLAQNELNRRLKQ